MKNELNSIPEFNDIVFESRNKEYGAYRLRRDYN
ncbi:MAG: energy transducer TonB, partial [Bacteroidia bacterium]|nr:energy transducer TonB [Bacteroidia bacterium]